MKSQIEYKPYMVWNLTPNGWIVTNSSLVIRDQTQYMRLFSYYKQIIPVEKPKPWLNLKC